MEHHSHQFSLACRRKSWCRKYLGSSFLVIKGSQVATPGCTEFLQGRQILPRWALLNSSGMAYLPFCPQKMSWRDSNLSNSDGGRPRCLHMGHQCDRFLICGVNSISVSGPTVSGPLGGYYQFARSCAVVENLKKFYATAMKLRRKTNKKGKENTRPQKKTLYRRVRRGGGKRWGRLSNMAEWTTIARPTRDNTNLGLNKP